MPRPSNAPADALPSGAESRGSGLNRATQGMGVVCAHIPAEDPSEPCYESETIELLREVHERALAGDIDWLKTRGKVYQLVEAA